MSITKASVSAVAVIGVVVAAGLWISERSTPQVAATEVPAAVTPVPAAMPPATAAAPRRADARRALDVKAPPIPNSLIEREKPLLQDGTDLRMATADFADAQTFAAVAHASRNLNVPFVLLKDRIVRQHMSLTRAIHDLKPDVNAAIEADRARAEARSDVAHKGT